MVSFDPHSDSGKRYSIFPISQMRLKLRAMERTSLKINSHQMACPYHWFQSCKSPQCCMCSRSQWVLSQLNETDTYTEICNTMSSPHLTYLQHWIPATIPFLLKCIFPSSCFFSLLLPHWPCFLSFLYWDLCITLAYKAWNAPGLSHLTSYLLSHLIPYLGNASQPQQLSDLQLQLKTSLNSRCTSPTTYSTSPIRGLIDFLNLYSKLSCHPATSQQFYPFRCSAQKPRRHP